MLNVEQKIEGDKLILTIDLTKRGGLSGSGKTTLVASTQGNAKLTGKHDKIAYGLNVYTKAN